MSSETNEILKEIRDALGDIADSLAYIAASTDKSGGVVENVGLSASDIAYIGAALHSDGGVNLATGTSANKTFRTYGDPTVLSGDEDGLK